MPPANRKTCDFPGCNRDPPDDDGVATPYLTPPDLQRRKEVVADLKEHVNMAHLLPLQHVEYDVKRTAAETAKIEAENKRTILNRPPEEQQQQQLVLIVPTEELPKAHTSHMLQLGPHSKPPFNPWERGGGCRETACKRLRSRHADPLSRGGWGARSRTRPRVWSVSTPRS